MAKALVEARLAGCVNIIRNIAPSTAGRADRDEPEVLMVVKTQKSLFEELQRSGTHS